MKILLVDADLYHLQIADNLLKKEGYRVNRATDGRSCLKSLAKDKPDLVLLNIGLPDIDGIEVCKTIKRTPEFSLIHIILLSDTEMQSERISEGLETGADGYLVKPLQNREFLARIEAEHRIIQAEMKLATLKTRNDAILASAPDIIMEVDQNKIYTWSNPAGYQFFGNDVIGKEASFYFEGDQSTYADVQPLFDGGEETYYTESFQRRQDGEKRLLSWWCRVLKDETGKVTGAISTARDITQAMQSQIELQRSVQNFRNLFNNLTEGVAQHEMVFDHTGKAVDYRILGVNPSFEANTNLDEGMVVGKLATEAYGVAEPPYLEIYSVVAETGVPTTIDSFFEPMNKHFTISVSSPQKGQFVTIFQDVTERKLTEIQLQKLNRTYAILSEINKAIIRSHQPKDIFDISCNIAVQQGGFIMAWIGLLNPQTKQVEPFAFAGNTGDYLDNLNISLDHIQRGHGPTATALKRAHYVVVNDISDDPNMLPWRDHALRLGYRSSVSFPLIVAGAVRGAFNLYASETNFFTEDELKLLLEMSANIAFALEFHEEEEKRTEAENALRESEERFRNLFEHMSDGILLANPTNEQFVMANKSICRMLGYTKEEILAIGVKDIHPATDITRVEEVFQLQLSGKLLSGSDIPVKRKDGSVFFADIVSTPITVEGRKLLMGSFRDISERKQSEEELRKAKIKAEQSDRLKSTFLANMSHEIRTPMNAIVGFSSLLTDPEQNAEDRDKFSHIIQSRSDELMHIINDLLEISRIESGNATVVKERVTLNIIMDEMEEVFRQKMKRSKKLNLSLIFKKELTDDRSSIFTDSYILKHVFSNLIENAIKYTESGYIQFGYHLPENGFITCFVTDTGLGISPENRYIIFEHFRQADSQNPHKYGGTGLGLSICKGSLALLGGEIWVESELGKGSTFLFRIPFEPVSPQIQNKEFPMDKPKSDNLYDWADKQILLVEDEMSNMEFLKVILGRTKAKLFMAFNGSELKVLYPQLDSIDLVLLDVRLPDASGWDLAREIKTIRPGLPIIAQTAYAMSDDLQKSKQAGCDNYISKPINKEKLLVLISKYLQKR